MQLGAFDHVDPSLMTDPWALQWVYKIEFLVDVSHGIQNVWLTCVVW